MTDMAFSFPRRKRMDHTEALGALERAQAAKERVAGQREEAMSLAKTLREMRETNHFRERMVALMKGAH